MDTGCCRQYGARLCAKAHPAWQDPARWEFRARRQAVVRLGAHYRQCLTLKLLAPLAIAPQSQERSPKTEQPSTLSRPGRINCQGDLAAVVSQPPEGVEEPRGEFAPRARRHQGIDRW